jgi:hypothetical protein
MGGRVRMMNSLIGGMKNQFKKEVSVVYDVKGVLDTQLIDARL